MNKKEKIHQLNWWRNLTRLLLVSFVLPLSACNSGEIGGQDHQPNPQQTSRIESKESASAKDGKAQLTHSGYDDEFSWHYIPGELTSQSVNIKCIYPNSASVKPTPGTITLIANQNNSNDAECVGVFRITVQGQNGFAISMYPNYTNFNGAACSVDRWDAYCNELQPVNTTQTLTIGANVDPGLRAGNVADIYWVDTRGPDSHDLAPIPISEAPQGSDSVSQDPAIIASGAPAPVSNTNLTIITTGPSNTKNVHLTEDFPRGMQVTVANLNCLFNSQTSSLNCNWDYLQPETLVIPIGLAVGESWTFGQYNPAIKLSSEYGEVDATANIMVAGGILIGMRDLPDTAFVGQVITDAVKFQVLQPKASITELHYETNYSSGLQVIDVRPANDTSPLICTHTNSTATCTIINLEHAVDTAANVSLKVIADDPQTQSAELKWNSDGGIGKFTTNIYINPE